MTSRIEIGNYAINKIPYNWQVEKYEEGGKAITIGEHRGKLSKPKWKKLDSFHSNPQKALVRVARMMAEEGEEVHNLQEAIDAYAEIEGRIKLLLEGVSLEAVGQGEST